jgi:hypothetical protein
MAASRPNHMLHVDTAWLHETNNYVAKEQQTPTYSFPHSLYTNTHTQYFFSLSLVRFSLSLSVPSPYDIFFVFLYFCSSLLLFLFSYKVCFLSIHSTYFPHDCCTCYIIYQFVHFLNLFYIAAYVHHKIISFNLYVWPTSLVHSPLDLYVLLNWFFCCFFTTTGEEVKILIYCRK